MHDDKFKSLSLAQVHTAEMNAARENAEHWCEAVGKLTAEKDAEIARLTAELADFKRHAQGVSDAQEEALATERASREQAEAGWHEQRERAQDLEQQSGVLMHDLEEAMRSGEVVAGLKAQAERERDTLLARVKELEKANELLEHSLGGCRQGRDWHDEKRLAAETALASARELAEQLVQSIEDNYGRDEIGQDAEGEVDGVIDADLILEDIKRVREALTSHPAPVAATPVRRCVPADPCGSCAWCGYEKPAPVAAK